MGLFNSSNVISMKCFYCNRTSPIVRRGRIREWSCPNCDALNFLQENGTIADEIPQDRQGDIRTEYRPAGAEKLSKLSSPFCSVCTSNQALLVKTLANYLPEDNHPDITVYERALPAYKASLEERYPPVCSACAPKVQARLQRNNYVAKSTALGNWLSNTKKLSRLTSGPGRPRKLLLSLFWLVRGFIWLTSSIGTILWFLLGVLSPANQKFVIIHANSVSTASITLAKLSPIYVSQEAQAYGYNLIYFFLPLSLVGTLWNHKSLTLIWNENLRVQGKDEYIKLQSATQVIRFFSVYAMPVNYLTVDIYRRISMVLLLLSVLHLVFSFRVLELIPKTKVNLKDISSTLQDTLSREVDADYDPPSIPINILNEVEPDEPSNEDDSKLDSAAEYAMDWEASSSPAKIPSASPFTVATGASSIKVPRMFPTPVFAQPREHYFTSNQAHSSAFSSTTRINEKGQLHLAKQKFFAPERPTGLENLFSAAVRLDDEPLLVRSIKSVQRQPRGAAWALTMACAGQMPLLWFNQFFLASVYGTMLSVCCAYLGLLKGMQTVVIALWPIAWLVVYHISMALSDTWQAIVRPVLYTTTALHFIVQTFCLRKSLFTSSIKQPQKSNQG